MRPVIAVAFIRGPADVPGVRRYRVWRLGDRIEVVRACPLIMRPAGAWMWAALALAACIDGSCLFALAVASLALGAHMLRALWLRHRARCLRKRGARPGPWIWAIDAESAACTARIRAAAQGPGDQPRRTPSMRIQSPSCSQRRWSNHAA